VSRQPAGCVGDAQPIAADRVHLPTALTATSRQVRVLDGHLTSALIKLLNAARKAADTLLTAGCSEAVASMSSPAVTAA